MSASSSRTPKSGAAATAQLSATPSIKPFPLDATRRILECQHIIDQIVAYTPRATQVACLRVSTKFLHAAGRSVYHTVRIDGDNMEAFFRGALNETSFDVSGLTKCGFAMGLKKCDAKGDKDKDKGDQSDDKVNNGDQHDDKDDKDDKDEKDDKDDKDDKGDQHDAEHDDKHDKVMNDYKVGSTTPHTGTSSPPKKTSKIMGNVKKKKSMNNKKKSKGNKKKSKRRKKSGSESSKDTTQDEPEGPPNFKFHLLKHVRVLTISSHHGCVCRLYGRYAKGLLPNLDVVRVASEFVHMFKLLPFCDDDECSLLKRLQTRKLVLRNLDGSGLPLEPFGDTYKICDELVVFLPTDGRRYDYDIMDFNSLQELGHYFIWAPDTKIVFYPTWEGWDESDELSMFIHGHAPVTPDDIVYKAKPFMEYADPKYTIYGMDKLRWSDDGDLAGVFQHHFPNTPMTQRTIHDLVRTELRTGSLFCAIMPLKGEVFEYDPGYPETVTYKSFTQYLIDKDGRRGEINAED